MTLIGRAAELKQLQAWLAARQPILLHGAEGVGKTALITEAIRDVADTIYCADSSTVRRAYESLLASRGVRAAEENNRARNRALREAIGERDVTLIFDHLGWVDRRLQAFLQRMFEEHALALVARDPSYAQSGHLRLVGWRLQELELRALSAADSRRLAVAETKRLRLAVGDRETFARTVAQISRGNPRVIVELCAQAQKVYPRNSSRLAVQLMDWDRRLQKIGSEKEESA